MRIASLFVSFAIASTSIAQCIGWFPAPWAPLRPDPTGHEYPERSMFIDLATEGPSEVVMLHLGAGNHSADSFNSGPNAYIDSGNGWQLFGTFSPFGTFTSLRIDQAAAYRGEIIVSGSFGSVNGVAATNIARWDGTNWHSLAEGLPGVVTNIVVYQDQLFANGYFGAKRWNGSAWSDATLFVPQTGAQFSIRPIFLREYMGGLVTVWEQVSVARWTTDHWEPLFSANSATNPLVDYMEVAGDRIAFGCYYSPGSRFPNLALFDGTTYRSCCTLCWANGWGGGSVSHPRDIDGDGTLDLLASVSSETYCTGCPGGYRRESASLMSLNNATNFEPSTFQSIPGVNPLYCRFKRYGDYLGSGYQWISGYPYFNFGPRNQSITHPNRDAIFSSTVTNVPQVVNYTWTRNAIPLQDGPTPHGSVISGAHTSRLTIQLPTAFDAGAYSLTVENPGCQTATSLAAYLSVCLADFNSDAVADFFDYLDFVQAFADNSAAADFNADGITDFFDYLDFVAAFSVGC